MDVGKASLGQGRGTSHISNSGGKEAARVSCAQHPFQTPLSRRTLNTLAAAASRVSAPGPRTLGAFPREKHNRPRGWGVPDSGAQLRAGRRGQSRSSVPDPRPRPLRVTLRPLDSACPRAPLARSPSCHMPRAPHASPKVSRPHPDCGVTAHTVQPSDTFGTQHPTRTARHLQ